MPYATPYNRSTSFSNYAAENPSRPLPGTGLDQELNAIRLTLSQIIANQKILQNPDGTLAPRTVTTESLDASFNVGFNPPTTWQTATEYTVLNAVYFENALYGCVLGHTSTDFATDLAAGLWTELIDFADMTGEAEAAAALAEAWAIKTDAPVEGGEFSAKYWATHEDVGAVADAIADIETCAANIAAIQAAPTHASNAAQSAIDAATAVQVGNFYTGSGTGDTEETEFDLGHEIVTENRVFWFEGNDRVMMEPGVDFTVSGTVLTRASPPPAEPFFWILLGAAEVNAPTAGSVVPASLHSSVAERLVPMGTMFDFTLPTPPDGYIMAYGQALTTAMTDAAEYRQALIDASFPYGESSGDPLVPDCRDRVRVGVGNMGGNDAGRISVGDTELGDAGGVDSVTLAVTQMPAHDHGGSTGNQNLSITYQRPQNNVRATGATPTRSGVFENVSISGTNHNHSISSQGGGQAHPNVQPYLAQYVIIKL